MPRSLTTHIDSAKDVGRRLKEARTKAACRSVSWRFPGCTAAYISRLEAGARIPSLQMVNQLAVRLDVTGSWLATGVDAVAVEPADLVEAEVALRLGELDTAEALYRTHIDAGDPCARDRACGSRPGGVRARPRRGGGRAARAGTRLAQRPRARRSGRGRHTRPRLHAGRRPDAVDRALRARGRGGGRGGGGAGGASVLGRARERAHRSRRLRTRGGGARARDAHHRRERRPDRARTAVLVAVASALTPRRAAPGGPVRATRPRDPRAHRERRHSCRLPTTCSRRPRSRRGTAARRCACSSTAASFAAASSAPPTRRASATLEARALLLAGRPADGGARRHAGTRVARGARARATEGSRSSMLAEVFASRRRRASGRVICSRRRSTCSSSTGPAGARGGAEAGRSARGEGDTAGALEVLKRATRD